VSLFNDSKMKKRVRSGDSSLPDLSLTPTREENDQRHDIFSYLKMKIQLRTDRYCCVALRSEPNLWVNISVKRTRE
jgi:hypothetical protein